jgi:hypothetical protein
MEYLNMKGTYSEYILAHFPQDLISLFQPEIRPDNLRPLALLLELLTVIPEEFSTLLLPSQKRAQVTTCLNNYAVAPGYFLIFGLVPSSCGIILVDILE